MLSYVPTYSMIVMVCMAVGAVLPIAVETGLQGGVCVCVCVCVCVMHLPKGLPLLVLAKISQERYVET